MLILAVSPWFSTHFNTKNWVFICEDQPQLRWQQMLEMKPALVEIISWNGKLSTTSPLWNVTRLTMEIPRFW